MWLGVIWIMGMVIAGVVAVKKGRSAIIHGVMAFILSPIWILVPLLAEGFKPCPKCGRKNKDSIRICQCGNAV